MPARRSPRWPRPIVINPQISPHKQTFIILHDRGSNATDFGPALLFRPFHRSRNASITRYFAAHSTTNLHKAFPHAKFVFPTASLLRAAAFTESFINQWFDTHWPLTENNVHNPRNSLDEESRSDLPVPGLRDAVRYVHDLIKAEIRILDGDASSVVIGGFSQGSAASLISVLLWEGDPLGGWFGLNGWLPFAEEVMNAAQQDNEHDNEESTPLVKGTALLRRKLDVPDSSQTGDAAEQGSLNMPLFIAHGTEDRTVPMTLGRQTADTLKDLGWGGQNLQWKDYRGLAHTYSEKMLSDMVEFFTERLL